MTNHTTRSAEEAKTHELIENFRKTHEWRQDTQIVMIVFKAMWSSALPIDQINKIGSAMANLVSEADLQEACTILARAKVLRSRQKNGRRFYEVNF